MNKVQAYLKSSLGRKQIVAITGLMLIGFLIGHLAGNLFIFMGPEAFNAYAKKLQSLRPGLLIVEAGLLGIFLLHVILTISIVRENRAARPVAYAVQDPKGKKSNLAAVVMPMSGFIVFAFVVVHLLDFTFADHHSSDSIVAGVNLGLYGLVYNSFLNPLHSLFYIVAMFCIGLHLNHGVQSFIQTMGWQHPTLTPLVKKTSAAVALLISVGFSSIPLYIYITNI